MARGEAHELSDGARLFRAAFEHAVDATMLVDSGGALLDANPAACALFGLAHTELRGWSFIDLLDCDEATGADWATFAGSARGSRTCSIATADGDTREVECRLVADIVPGTHLLIARDVTERVQQERDLRASEEQYRALTEGSPDPIGRIDSRHRISYANQAVERLAGHPREELLDRDMSALGFPGHMAEAWRQAIDSVFATGEEAQLEVAQPGPEGTRWHQARLAPQFAPDGSVTQVAFLNRDITDLKEAERTAREASVRQEQVLASITDGFVAFDAALHCVYVNDAAVRMMQRPHEELLGTALDAFFPVDCDTPCAAHIRQVVIEREAATFESYCPPPIDTWYSVRSYPAPDGGATVYFRDVGDQRRLQSRLQQAQKLEALGQLAGGVAHDFNNLLTSILGYAELAAEELPDEHPARYAFTELRASALRAADVVAQLLAFARRQPHSPKPLALDEVLIELHGLLDRATHGSVVVDVDLPEGLWPISADRAQLEQVLVNLAANANDAMPEGGTLRFTALNAAPGLDNGEPASGGPADGEWVLLRVADTGVGMDAETMMRAFEPFFTTKGPGKGTGLGLASVYGIVAQSGGLVTIESELGVGSSFWIWWPRSLSAAPPKLGTEPLGDHHHDRTVLVVEDDAAVRRVIVEALQLDEYRIFEASSGVEAQAVADRLAGGVDLLVTDMVMPEISVDELVARLRKRSPDLAVILVSGYAYNEGDHAPPSDTRAAFLRKPFSLTDLLDTARRLLGSDASQPQP